MHCAKPTAACSSMRAPHGPEPARLLIAYCFVTLQQFLFSSLVAPPATPPQRCCRHAADSRHHPRCTIVCHGTSAGALGRVADARISTSANAGISYLRRRPTASTCAGNTHAHVNVATPSKFSGGLPLSCTGSVHQAAFQWRMQARPQGKALMLSILKASRQREHVRPATSAHGRPPA